MVYWDQSTGGYFKRDNKPKEKNMRTFVQAGLIVCWLLIFGFALSYGKRSKHSYPPFNTKLAAYKITVVEVHASV